MSVPGPQCTEITSMAFPNRMLVSRAWIADEISRSTGSARKNVMTPASHRGSPALAHDSSTAHPMIDSATPTDTTVTSITPVALMTDGFGSPDSVQARR